MIFVLNYTFVIKYYLICNQLKMEKPNSQTPHSKSSLFPKIGTLRIFLPFALGILFGVLYVQKVTNYLPSIMPVLMTVFVTVFIILLFILIFLPKIFNLAVKRYTGIDTDIESLVGGIQNKVTDIADVIADTVLVNTNLEVKQHIKKDLPHIIYYIFFSRLRSTGLRFLMTVFTAIAGLMGTILLYNQNQLLNNQNQLLSKQNDKIDNQIYLEEASRRSALVMLMSNLMDKVDREIENQQKGFSEKSNNKKLFKLSQSLIGQIAALSHSFKPYRFMENDSLISEPFSPERGQLLITLIRLPFDSITLESIYKVSTFERAYLKGANLKDVNLSNINLRFANLSGADLSEANLSSAKLTRADLSRATLIHTNLSYSGLIKSILNYANFEAADLSNANLSNAALNYVNLNGANLSDSKLENADLSDSKLEGADLSDANLENVNLSGSDLTLAQVLKTNSLYRSKNLQDSVRINILRIKPELLEPPKY
jgi:uncharacterized protein YjbI with pentapeptide repeats